MERELGMEGKVRIRRVLTIKKNPPKVRTDNVSLRVLKTLPSMSRASVYKVWDAQDRKRFAASSMVGYAETKRGKAGRPVKHQTDSGEGNKAAGKRPGAEQRKTRQPAGELPGKNRIAANQSEAKLLTQEAGGKIAVSGQKAAVSGQRRSVADQKAVVSDQRRFVPGQRAAISVQGRCVTDQKAAVFGQKKGALPDQDNAALSGKKDQAIPIRRGRDREVRIRRLTVRRFEKTPRIKGAAVRRARRRFPERKEERPGSRSAYQAKPDMGTWNPVISRKQSGFEKNGYAGIRTLSNRGIHKQVHIRNRKKAKAEELEAFFDSLPPRQKEEIAKKALRKAKRKSGRKRRRENVKAAGRILNKQMDKEAEKLKEQEHKEQQGGRDNPVAEQLWREWMNRRRQRERFQIKKKDIQRAKQKLIKKEAERQEKAKRAKEQRKALTRIRYFREKASSGTKQVISFVEEAIKKKAAQAKADALKYMLAVSGPFLIVMLLFLTVVIAVTGEAGMEEERNRSASEIIEFAVSWAERIAADDSHGYDNTKEGRWGPDYACSSFVITAWEQAGVPVKTAGASYTANMKKHFLQNGFIDVTASVNLETGSGMQRGDVFIRPGVHTEMAVSGTKLVGARGEGDSGEPQNGKVGDQGGEISVSGFFPDNWKYVLRYVGNGDGSGSGLGYQIVSYAKGFVGRLPYIWGGTSLETGADCSGFTQAIFAQFGVNLPRTAEEQAVNGKAISALSQAQAGDIIYYSGTETGHVGIYTGDGQIVHCANSRDGTKISSATYRPISAIRRYIADADTGNFSGNTNEEICWNFFISQGFSPAATAGILGNFYVESGFDPAIHQIGGGPGRGIAQWESSSGGSGRFDKLVSYANGQGMSWESIQTQLKFVMYELNSGSMNPFFSYVGGISAYKASSSAAQAAYDWLVAYEYCGTGFNPQDFNLAGRQAYAVDCLKRHGG